MTHLFMRRVTVDVNLQIYKKIKMNYSDHQVMMR